MTAGQHWVFLDLETGGVDPLDPRAQWAEILEVAVVAVDNRLNEVAHWTSPIKPKCGTWHNVLPPRVREMHDGSGLTRAIKCGEHYTWPQGGGLPTAAEAEAVCLQFMAQYAPGKSSPLCGANVGRFDARWLRVHMPALHDAFHYRCLDSNFCFLADQFFGGIPSVKGETRHRALDDARQSIATVRRFFGAGA